MLSKKYIATRYNYIKTVRMLDNEKVLFDWLLDCESR